MSWHLIRIFWLSLFALVLPAQALACLEEQSATTNLSAPPSVVQTLNQQPTANEHKPVQSTPATQSHYAGSGLAILNSVRWNISERYSFSDGDPDVLDTVLPFYPIIDTSLVLRFLQRSTPAAYQGFHPSYRLSGWKETNAMYVALNSQYFI
ncbi:hypothetical protein KW492_20685 [Vibrio fluvialis]|nr:hypothetical protein [Vibrio fluvialis]